MNIFAVDSDPKIAARMLCDKHVVKMVVEGCQMLSTNHLLSGDSATEMLYKLSFKNHPCTLWARETTGNYQWLSEHTHELSVEYTRRYGKVHKSSCLCLWFVENIPKYIPHGSLTAFAQAMPDEYKNNDPVVAYRTYYAKAKSRIARWKLGNVPEWYKEMINAL